MYEEESNSKQMRRGEDEDMTNLRMQTKYAALLPATRLFSFYSQGKLAFLFSLFVSVKGPL